MNYSVKELREKLSERVLGLGIDARFLENPAFASAIAEIDDLIGQMNMFEAAEAVTVKEENGNISFDWYATGGNKYSMSISSSDPKTFRCVKKEEKPPYIDTAGQTIKQKDVVEKVATIDESGIITLTINGSMINNKDCERNKCNNSTWSEKKSYTSDGVMYEREIKNFSTRELPEDFDRARIDSMLYIPREAAAGTFLRNQYESRTLLVRDKLDTARIVIENRKEGISYHATTPLNQENGLRDMFTVGGPLLEDVFIPPLSEEEIEAMIQRESNPKVAEGLRKYAVGRNTYSYNSAEDKNFVCEGISESKDMSR